MPAIAIEFDPNLSSTASNYSTASFTPNDVAPADRNRWSPYIDATDPNSGTWFVSGAAGAAITCDQASNGCTWDEMQAGLNDGGDEATIYTVAINKGRDYAWVGAVDGLRVDNTFYDFEPFGVSEVPAS